MDFDRQKQADTQLRLTKRQRNRQRSVYLKCLFLKLGFGELEDGVEANALDAG